MSTPVYEWDIVVRHWNTYGNRVETSTPAKIHAATKADVTTKVRLMFGATYNTSRKFWSHDWTLNSVTEISTTEGTTS